MKSIYTKLQVHSKSEAVAKAIDNPALTPVQFELCSFNGSLACASANPDGFTVPADRRLVLEYVSGYCQTQPAGTAMHGAGFRTTVGSTQLPHEVVAVETGDYNGTLFGIAQPTRVYADPATVVKIVSPAVENYRCPFSFSGHLVAP